MKNLNFNSLTKKYLTVTLNDEKNTTILVQSPTKKVMDYLIEMDKNASDENSIEQIDSLYYICAEIMSRNMSKTKITKEYLEETLDIEDVITFFRTYLDFINLQTKGKN